LSSSPLENLPPLIPSDFFALTCPIPYAKKIPERRIPYLPDRTDLLGEEGFSKVALFWNEEALFIKADVYKPFEEALYPDFREGDSVEVFIDTRDLKMAGYPTKFCHHFVFFPVESKDVFSREVSVFREEDSHPLCDPKDLFVEVKVEKLSYQLNITIPSHALHGYEPASFKRLGFTYRVNRYQGEPEHFALSSTYYQIEKHPSLWASLLMEAP